MRFKAKGRPRHTLGQMNGTEKSYEEYLKQQSLAGQIYSYNFEAVKFKLADKTYYTPDFMVINKNLEVEFRETKGTSRGKPFIEDDAAVKIKVAAAMYPQFIFKLAWKVAGQWLEKEYGA